MKALMAKIIITADEREYIEDAVLLVNGTKIVKVGSKKRVKIPKEAEIIDVGDHIIMPGLMEMHTHLYGLFPKIYPWTDVGPGLNFGTYVEQYLLPVGLRLFHAARNAEILLGYGFTTIRDHSFPEYVSVKQAIALGWIPGPRIFVGGRIYSTSSHLDQTVPALFPHRQASDGVDAVRKTVREYIKQGVDYIKISISGGAAGFGEVHWRNYSTEELKAIVEEAGFFDKDVAAHCYTAAGIQTAVEVGVRSIEHGSFFAEVPDQTIDLMKQKKIFLVPTISHYSQELTEDIPEKYRQKMQLIKDVREAGLKCAIENGVDIAMGTDLYLGSKGTPSHGNELKFYVKLGMSPIQAIRSATIKGAELLRCESSLGTLEEGKLTDFIVVKENPLEDITVLGDKENIIMVWKDGVKVVDKCN